MHINFHLDILTTVVLVLRLKKATIKRLVTCFRDVATVLEHSREYRLLKTWHNGTHNANLLMMIRWS